MRTVLEEIFHFFCVSYLLPWSCCVPTAKSQWHSIINIIVQETGRRWGLTGWLSWSWLGFLRCFRASWLSTGLHRLQLWQPQWLGFPPQVFHPPADLSKYKLIAKAEVQDRGGSIAQVLFKSLFASNLPPLAKSSYMVKPKVEMVGCYKIKQQIVAEVKMAAISEI